MPAAHRQKDRRKYRFRARFFLLLIMVILLAFAIVRVSMIPDGGSRDTSQASDSNIAGMDIMFAGDLVMHTSLLQASTSNGTCDISSDFRYIKKYIKNADIAVCDLETTFSGSTTGYPRFSSPSSVADSLAGVGFDLVGTANNHAYDYGHSGLMKTLRGLKAAGLKTAGTRGSADGKRFAMFTVDGVRVAIMPYTFATGSGSSIGLNGLSMGSDRQYVNYFTYSSGGARKIANTEKAARKAGADIVIAYMHWGEEYTQVNSSQKTLVKRLLKESTIDAVIGSHPHVVQKYTTMTNSAGAEVPVYYAIGNLLSNQRSEILNHGISTEEGALVDISIKYDKDKDKVQSLKTEAIPYWVDKYTDGKVKYRIIPLTGEYKNNEALKVSGHAAKAAEAKKNVYERLGINN